ncbi:MAG: hypothetical protein HYY16_11870 [Planctomycetes bacterium]|nr:hypothetical protein [Planctomycetota bacterium]
MGVDFGFLLFRRSTLTHADLLTPLKDLCVRQDVRDLVVVVRSNFDLREAFADVSDRCVGTFVSLWSNADADMIPLDALAQKYAASLSTDALAAFVSDHTCTGGYQLFGPQGLKAALRVGEDAQSSEEIGYTDAAWLGVEQLFEVRLALTEEDRLFFTETLIGVGDQPGASKFVLWCDGDIVEPPEDLPPHYTVSEMECCYGMSWPARLPPPQSFPRVPASTPAWPRKAPPALEQAPSMYELSTVLTIGRVAALARHPSRPVLAVAGSGLHLLDCASQQIIRSLMAPATYSAAFAQGGRLLMCEEYRSAGAVLHTWSGPDYTDHAQHEIGDGRICSIIGLHSDGAGALLGMSDGRVIVWDAERDRLLKSMKEHTGRVSALAYEPRSGVAYSGAEDGRIVAWDLASGKCLKAATLNAGWIRAIVLSHDGRFLAAGTRAKDGTLLFLRLPELIDAGRFLAHHIAVNSLATLGATGQVASGGGLDGIVNVWRFPPPIPKEGTLPSPSFSLEKHEGWVEAIAYVQDTGTLYSAGDDGLRLWDLANRCVPPPLLAGHVCFVRFMRHGTGLVTVRTKTIETWDLGTHQSTIIAELTDPRCAAVSSDGSRVAVGWATHRRNKIEFLLQVWDTLSGARVLTLELSAAPYSVALSADGATVFCGDDAGRVRQWETESGRILHEWEAHEGLVRGLSVDEQGHRMASCGGDARISLWDLRTGRREHVLKGHATWVTAAQFTRDGTRLFSASLDTSVRAWDVAIGKQLFMLNAPGEFRNVRLFPDDSRLMASSVEDVWIWSLQDRRLLERIRSSSSHHTTYELPIDVNAAGTIVTGGDELRLWKPRRG